MIIGGQKGKKKKKKKKKHTDANISGRKINVIQLSRCKLAARLVDRWASLMVTHANSCPVVRKQIRVGESTAVDVGD